MHLVHLRVHCTSRTTSIMISSFKSREARAEAIRVQARDGCAFCGIIKGDIPAFKVYEDANLVAFLDILPIRRGHTLLVPKEHHERLTDLPDAFSAEMGRILPRLCRAVCNATDQKDFNIVNNNGYGQVVPHVHWHIVPAPKLNEKDVSQKDSNLPIGFRELQRREELDDDEGEKLAKLISDALKADSRSRL
ncbi:HIT-like protein [Cystobasidium minutum MCA 4210]|uniref:HIT-like protein n=1 Tax=Cystobasidium minutum MCA 4210 TaxID=1397322 RepID=UPI0034CD3877|eukprot:jgi/Rhomi1/48300/CE48299_2065